jgi:SNF2 family DNA or RNA helicase
MKISIDNGEATILVSGIPLLKLKTEIGKRIGNLQKAGKDTITVPASALPLIQDLLDDEAKSDNGVRSHLEAFERHHIARDKALMIIEDGGAETVPAKWIEVLDPAQATAVAAMTMPDILGLCLFDEQGSGKTVMSIAAFDVLKDLGVVDAMIVVCPKSMVSEWPKDIQRFTKEKYITVAAEGDKRQKYEAALKNFDIIVTNYEGVDVMLTSLVASAATTRYLLVVDESYYLKNSDSVRSEKVERLRAQCARCFVLCGTPAPNSANDLVNQFDLADLGYTFGGFTKAKDPADDWDEIARLVETRGLFIRRLKPEILQQVPEKNFHVIRVDLKGKQALMYAKARSELELELKTLSNDTFKKRLATYFQRRAALLQICACPGALDPTLSETPVKYAALDELLERLVSEKRKVIVWSFFKRSLDEMMERYRSFYPVRVDGSVASSDRKAAVKSLQEDPNTMLFFGNPAAAGAGITLHAAYDAVYVSYSNQAAHYLQSLDRIHRRGQVSDHVNYHLLVCKDTIEETEIIRLRRKEISQHELLGDHIPWPTSLDDALEELGGHV